VKVQEVISLPRVHVRPRGRSSLQLHPNPVSRPDPNVLTAKPVAGDGRGDGGGGGGGLPHCPCRPAVRRLAQPHARDAGHPLAAGPRAARMLPLCAVRARMCSPG
jgi:hypothetical protein